MYRVNWKQYVQTGQLDQNLKQIDVILVKVGVSSVFHCFLLLVSYSTPVQDLIGDTDTPSQCIVELSKALDQCDDMKDDWRRLWSELLNRPIVEEVVNQKKEGPTRFLLKLWCRTKPPSQATVAHLIEALNSIYRNDIARIVENYCKVCICSLVYWCDESL